MGLDMYLYKRTYIGAGHEWSKNTAKLEVFHGEDKVQLSIGQIEYIIEEAGYWRKAYPIHRWFVKNVKGGVDIEADFHVSLDKLRELLVPVNRILEVFREKGEEGVSALTDDSLFPIQDIDLDPYYIETLERTRDMIEGILTENENRKDGFWVDYYYSSSF